MDDLLSQLEPPRRWSWAAVAIGLSLGIGVGVAGGVLGGVNHEQPCLDSAEQLGEAWSPWRAEQLESHLERIEHPSPVEQAQRVDRQLQAYARDWEASHADTCAATRVTQVQSDSLFDRRMLCLQRRRSRLATTGDLLLDAPDLATLNQRMPAAFTLPAIDDCNNIEALMREVPLPSDPTQRAEIHELYEQIDLADTHREAGALEEGLALAEQLVPRARQLGYAPVLAQALQALGRLQTDTSPARAEHTIREAIEVASRGRDPLRVALAWPSLLYALTLQGKSAEGEQLEFAARAAIDFADDPKARAWLHNDLGTLYAEMSHTVEAIDHLERSLELKIMLDGDKHYDVGITRNNLGFALAFDDQWPQARLAFELARDNFAANVGPEHPMVGIALSGLCQVELGAKNYELALSRCAEARLLMKGPSLSAELLQRVDYLTARALWGLGRRYDAIEWARATIRNAGTTDSPIIGTIHRWLSKPERDLGAPLADTAQLEPGPSKP